MALNLKVKPHIFSNGERFAFLVDKRTGIPLYDPTVFALKKLRARGLMANTIEQAMRSLLFLYQALESLTIDLDDRMRNQQFLTMNEVEEIVRLSSLRQEALDDTLRLAEPNSPQCQVVVNLESVRMRTPVSREATEVDSETAAIRILYVHQYLKWFAARRLLQMRKDRASVSELLHLVHTALDALKEQAPKKGTRNPVDGREGLSIEVQNRLLEVIRPDSPENPWKNQHTRHRNQLLIHLLLGCALRRGEGLGVKVADLNLREGMVRIPRRADDPDDPRTPEAVNKTNSKDLGLSRPLAGLILDYMNKHRKLIAGRHNGKYLFLATGTGAPLSLSAVSKVFQQLRKKIPDLPEDLCAHVLRHTWNERYSEQMDALGVQAKDEEDFRNYQNGWSPNSRAAKVYTRRHIREASNKASLGMQELMFSKQKAKTQVAEVCR